MSNTSAAFTTCLGAIAAAWVLQAMSQAVSQATPRADADRAAIFAAAGATQRGGRWLLCAEDPQTQGASIGEVRDLNGDGHPEAVVNEDGTFCNGHAGTGYVLVSRGADGVWTRMRGAAPGFPNS